MVLVLVDIADIHTQIDTSAQNCWRSAIDLLGKSRSWVNAAIHYNSKIDFRLRLILCGYPVATANLCSKMMKTSEILYFTYFVLPHNFRWQFSSDFKNKICTFSKQYLVVRDRLWTFRNWRSDIDISAYHYYFHSTVLFCKMASGQIPSSRHQKYRKAI